MAVKLYLTRVPSSGTAPVQGTCTVRVTCSNGDLSNPLNSGKYYVTIYANGSLLRSSIKKITGSSTTSIDVTTGSITLSTPGTYTLIAYLTDSDGGGLGYSSGQQTVTVSAAVQYTTTINYYGHGQLLYTAYVDGGDSHSVRSYTYSGWTLKGWATSTGKTGTNYDVGAKITASTSSDQTINLYAVYYRESTINCYYGVDMGGAGSPNTRTKRQYCIHTSTYGTSTDRYDNIDLPSFSSANRTITTTQPPRTWTAIGWRGDTDAAAAQYGSGATVAVNSSTGNFYAVYQNTDGILVSYNANGGSGTMASAKVTGTLYYNTAGNNSTITVTPRANEFTPPRGQQFKGWATSAGGDLVKSVSTAYNITFYAQWMSARPQNWSWSGYLTLNGTRTAYNMTPGGKPPMIQQTDGSYYAYYMGAAEWNNLRARVQEFADYLGVTLNYLDYNGSSAQAGQPMTRKQAQCMADMIDSLDPPKAVPTLTNDICVSFFTGLRDSLNSIP